MAYIDGPKTVITRIEYEHLMILVYNLVDNTSIINLTPHVLDIAGDIVQPQCDELVDLINNCYRSYNNKDFNIGRVDVYTKKYKNWNAVAKILHYMTNFARHIIVTDDFVDCLRCILDINDYDTLQFVTFECEDYVTAMDNYNLRVLRFIGVDGYLYV